jgi:hypothetical protein
VFLDAQKFDFARSLAASWRAIRAESEALSPDAFDPWVLIFDDTVEHGAKDSRPTSHPPRSASSPAAGPPATGDALTSASRTAGRCRTRPRDHRHLARSGLC